MSTDTANCLCGSSLSYQQCCELLHTGQAHALSAEALMRSRFTAYAMHNAAYLLSSWDDSTRPASIDFSKDTGEWTQLEVISTKKGTAKEHKGIVEFKAYFTIEGEQRVMNEISRFIKKQDRWFYLDGKVKSIGSAEGSFNQGLNAPCACGSGKKFKRCCGKK
ncbi:MAG: zinc chelation protein SecC [Methyloprofundus sp.]|nr:zinc chelation protein SecC [Methyloprofundus sp.]